MSKHTPGPWAYAPILTGDFAIYADFDGGKKIAVVDAWRPEGEANARLIAAAPDLLFALEELLAEFDARDRDAQREPGCMGIRETGGIVEARAAVSKARGQDADPA